MLVYVMGRAHTGSTVLDILLGNSAAIESVGQLVSDLGKLDKPCSCGRTIADCPFWRAVRARATADGRFSWEEIAAAHVGQAHVKRLLATWRASADPARAPSELRTLTAMSERVERAIREVAGKPVLLDSSKEPTRGLFVLKLRPAARVIHLVRDPRSVVTSYYWRLKSDRGFHFLRRSYSAPALAPLFLLLAAASWTAGNLLCELIARTAPDRVLRVRYEDLRDEPARELRRIGSALGLPVEDVAQRLERGEAFAVGHNIGGNQIREGARTIRFEPGKEESRRRLPRGIEIMTVLLCWPLMLRYRYQLGGQRRARRAAPAGAA
jgi:hypothetical protein